MIDPQTWRRIKGIVEEALERPAPDRALFVRDACGEDGALRAEVESLLASMEAAGSFANGPALDGLAERSGPSLRVGETLGDLEIVSLLGAGGMGEVYRARDRRLGREVAVKVLPQSFVSDPERLARLTREARLLASLNHPNIATIHGLEGRREGQGGPLALVMELVEGETLASRLGRRAPVRTPLPVAEALAIARQAADGLEAAHERGIVHRDLKPANIVLRADGTVKILDFGIAKALAVPGGERDLSTSPSVTAEGRLLGTPAYMSPEQARGQGVDKRTDIWAFGCVLYEILSGRAAFDGGTVSDTIAAVLSRDPDWAALPQDTPAVVRRVLRRCLAKDPRRRAHDIADVRIDLDEAASHPAEAGGGETAPGGSRARLGRWSERAIGGAVTVALLAGAAWLAYPPAGTGERGVVELAIVPPQGAAFATSAGGPWPMVSPDGSMVAFVALSPAGQQIWVRPLDSAVARALGGTEGAIRPFWSPDSRSLAFFANGQLLRTDLESSASRVICSAPYSGGLAGTWGDDTIVFNGPGGIRRVPATGGTPVLMLEPSDDLGLAVPSFLPDGRRFMYLRLTDNQRTRHLCVTSLDDSASTCPADAMSPVVSAGPDHLLSVSNGALQVQPFDPVQVRHAGQAVTVADTPIDIQYVWQVPTFSASRNGVIAYYARPAARLAWLDRTGLEVEVLPITGEFPGVSPEENRIVVERRNLQTMDLDLWLYDKESGAETRFTHSRTTDGFGAFSHDGVSVIYSDGGGILQKPVEGGTETRLLDVGAQPDLSSDGRYMVYQMSTPRTGFDLWVAPLTDDRTPFPVAQTEHGEREGTFSPDVRWLAYDSTETGRREVWVQPFPPTGVRWQVSATGGVSPKWRADGRELFYVAADGRLMSAAVTPGASFRWSAPQALFETIFRGGTYAPFAVSRDGQRFLINTPPIHEAPITVVVNWPERVGT